MTYDFDTPLDRCRSDSVKWRNYPQDVLPLWVADMDFRAPEPVIQALHERVEHGVFGYGCDPVELCKVVVERLRTHYGWQVAPDALVFIPGVARGFHLICRIFASAGDGVLVQPPVYPPILEAYAQAGLTSNEDELTRGSDGSYCIDLAAFEKAIGERTRVFLLCNPHNPVGRVFGREELMGMAEICLRHNILICSDEIHCDIVYPGYTHIPIASLAPEIEQRTITLMAPSKTFNIPGLKLAVAIIPNPELRKRFVALQGILAGPPNILAVAAATAAYRDSQPWLDALLAYLEGNRDYLLAYAHTHLPAIGVNQPEATFLAWLDCRQTNIAADPYQFFLDKARVALNDGASFGRGGAGFVRLNFGCPRSTLAEALERMSRGLAAVRG
jgi:cystathionine beta-lyase